jgi:prepilin-type N-terminal cleavage/methylation domain-containing protein
MKFPFYNRKDQQKSRTKRSGFTLIELLLVILLIAILMGLVTTVAQSVVRAAREKRLQLTCRTLETALARYRDEYNMWPIPRVASTLDGNYDPAWQKGSPYVYEVSGDDNKKWFTMLRVTSANTFNPKKIPFVDETTLFTMTLNKTRVVLSTERKKDGNENKAFPLVGVNRRGKTVYFKITINTDNDTVKVGYSAD